MPKEMKSLGQMPERSLEMCSIPYGDSKGPYFPSFYVNSKQMPEIDEWKVGEEYVITVKVKMNSFTSNDDAQNGAKSSANIELLEYATKTQKSLS